MVPLRTHLCHTFLHPLRAPCFGWRTPSKPALFFYCNSPFIVGSRTLVVETSDWPPASLYTSQLRKSETGQHNVCVLSGTPEKLVNCQRALSINQTWLDVPRSSGRIPLPSLLFFVAVGPFGSLITLCHAKETTLDSKIH